MIIFIIGGSGKVQSWNELKSDEETSAVEARSPDSGHENNAGKSVTKPEYFTKF